MLNETQLRDNFNRNHSKGLSDDPTISTTITTSVTLGINPYFSPLTITPTGAITPTTRGATALVVPASVSDASVANQGRILGAGFVGSVSGIGGSGGVGVQVASPEAH